MKSLSEWRQNLPEDQRSFRAAARRLGVSASELCRYESGKRRVPPERVVEFEGITKIPRYLLRPDVFPAPWETAA